MKGSTTSVPVTWPTVAREVNNLFGWRDPQTWRNLLYLLLTFPLGIAYFVFLMTGIALGAGLAVTLVGLPILVGMMVAWQQLGRFERSLAASLLGNDVPSARDRVAAAGLVARLKADLADGFTWRSLAYLLVEFPFGVSTFVVVVTLVSLALALATAPLSYWALPQGGTGSPDTFPKALVASVAGGALLWVTPRVVNGLAQLWAAFARQMLATR